MNKYLFISDICVQKKFRIHPSYPCSKIKFVFEKNKIRVQKRYSCLKER
jgi:hypothetical protein